MEKKLKLKKSIERLTSREDVRLTLDQVNHYLSSGQWTDESFVDYLELHAKRTPNAVAIIDEDGKKTTYSEYHKQTDQIALALLELGILPNDRIAIQLPNRSEFILSLMGAVKASILPVVCHMPYSEQDLDYVISLTEAKAIIIQDNFKNRNYLEMVKKVQKRHACLKYIIVISDNQYVETVNFYDLLQKEIKSTNFQLSETRPVGTDPFVITFTSGTTGKPKAVLHLHANNLFWIKQLNGIWEFPEEGKWLIVTPLAHLTGLALGVWRSLYRGDTITLLSSWNVNKAVELIESSKSSHFAGVAPMLIDIARFEGLEKRDISSLRGIVYAGAPCPIDILKTLHRRTGCKIYSNYGYSEGPVTHFTLTEDELNTSSTSFGHVADWVEAKIIDESGNELHAPCEGEVLVRGANFIPGYYGQPENNKKMFDDEGWFNSGDIVRIDKNGYGTFLSRKDDLINRGGYKIDPREIEEVLFTHPIISQVVVVAMPDERLGERIAAFLIQKDNSKPLSLGEITRFLSEKGVGKEYWPEAIKIVDSFPLTPSGKIQRFAIRKEANELSPTK
jgi:acyl-CoA synthetase (AMP-forming)/AMP-acid ligase II